LSPINLLRIFGLVLSSKLDIRIEFDVYHYRVTAFDFKCSPNKYIPFTPFPITLRVIFCFFRPQKQQTSKHYF
jgi:hypothetical protein